MFARPFVITILLGLFMAVALDVQGQASGVREVSVNERTVVPLSTRLRYTTMIVLPEGEEILDVICGDRDFWVISAAENVAHVKPAKPGAESNLNLVTARGAIYSFTLSEKSDKSQPDLKVYVTLEQGATPARQKYYSAAEMERVQSELTQAREAATRADQRAEAAIAADRQRYPTRMQFPYEPVKSEKPFFLRAIWHDGQFTYLRADARELPAIYEVLDGKPSIVNFQVHDGTYVVPKVLEQGYLALGDAKLNFRRVGR
jgi:type IV secretory pathway VirB9-like protein